MALRPKRAKEICYSFPSSTKKEQTEAKNKGTVASGAAMQEEIEEEGAPKLTRSRHIKKRALRNKTLSISFNEKDLKDFVGGFHKRKKKRRKEAQKKQEEALRRKRIEERKKRKLEKEFALFGGAPPVTDPAVDENDKADGEDEEGEPEASISGTTMYDNGDLKVTVTTSEISHDEDNNPGERTLQLAPTSVGTESKHNIPVSKKKSFKKVAKHKTRSRPQKKRDKKKGKKKNKRR